MIYKYCDITGFDILLNSRLKVTPLGEVNDPFEIRIGVDQVGGFNRVRNRYLSDLKAQKSVRDALKSRNSAHTEENVKEYLQRYVENQTRVQWERLAELREKTLKETGVICFSRSFDIVPLWAHYAGNHTGIVVGVGASAFDKSNDFLVPLNYERESPMLPILYDENDTSERKEFEEVVEEALKTKSSEWKVEDEVRLYSTLESKASDGRYYYPIDPALIREVYLGLKSSPLTRFTALSLKEKKYPHMKLFQMTLDNRLYCLKPVEILETASKV